MKRLLFLTTLLFLMTCPALAETKYCGSINTLAYITDSYVEIRMKLYNKDMEPRYMTVKDEATVTELIKIIKNYPNYEHKNELYNFGWYYKDSKDQYFVCVTGSDLREYRKNFYMDEVQKLEVWKNRKKLDLNTNASNAGFFYKGESVKDKKIADALFIELKLSEEDDRDVEVCYQGTWEEAVENEGEFLSIYVLDVYGETEFPSLDTEVKQNQTNEYSYYIIPSC